MPRFNIGSCRSRCGYARPIGILNRSRFYIVGNATAGGHPKTAYGCRYGVIDAVRVDEHVNPARVTNPCGGANTGKQMCGAGVADRNRRTVPGWVPVLINLCASANPLRESRDNKQQAGKNQQNLTQLSLLMNFELGAGRNVNDPGIAPKRTMGGWGRSWN